MSDYEKYVKAISKIFECTTLMKEALPNQDNISYIEGVEEYKEEVVKLANNFPKSKGMEELGK